VAYESLLDILSLFYHYYDKISRVPFFKTRQKGSKGRSDYVEKRHASGGNITIHRAFCQRINETIRAMKQIREISIIVPAFVYRSETLEAEISLVPLLFASIG
jgi:hypothetical protein